MARVTLHIMVLPMPVLVIGAMLHAFVMLVLGPVHRAVIVLVLALRLLSVIVFGLRRRRIVLMRGRRGRFGLLGLAVVVLVLREGGRRYGQRRGGGERKTADHSVPLLSQIP